MLVRLILLSHTKVCKASNNRAPKSTKKNLYASAGLVLRLLCIGLLMSSQMSVTSSAHANNEDLGIQASYLVNQYDLSLSLKEGIAAPSDVDTWAAIVNLLPTSFLKTYISEFQIFTDGVDNTLAFVVKAAPTEPAPLWQLAIDFEDITETLSSSAIETIMHEFAHILALNKTQLDFNKSDCLTYEIDEGCTKSDSYLLAWVEYFWSDDVFVDHEIDTYYLSGIAQENAVSNFYEQHTDKFLTEYSATNPIEDFAETFALFVLSEQPTKINTTVDYKVDFFHQYPELQDIRHKIRQKTDIRVTQTNFGK